MSRMACISCRDRKLKCNREAPACRRCVTSNEDCIYPVVRRTNRTKRKQVRDLETQLGHLEEQIRVLGASEAQDPPIEWPRRHPEEYIPSGLNSNLGQDFLTGQFTDTHGLNLPDEDSGAGPLTWPPPQELQEILTTVYFEKLHHAAPIIARQKYQISLLQPPKRQPLACLQYIIMASAADVVPAYQSMAVPLYERSRVLAQRDEMRDSGEHSVTIEHAQYWSLTAKFEARQAMFCRAPASLGKSIRVAQMLGLHHLDKDHHTLAPLPAPLKPAEDWQELEERRRTWWDVFIADRLVLVTTGLPTLIDDQDVSTRLPASEESFVGGQWEKTGTLQRPLRDVQGRYSELTARILAADLFHKILILDTRGLTERLPSGSGSSQGQGQGTEEYWIKFQHLDNDLAVMPMFLPAKLRLPQRFNCQHAVLVNILIHTATICLHQAGLKKVRRPDPNAPDSVGRHSQGRVVAAAEEILYVFRLTRDLDVALRNPVLGFAAYTAALVFLEEAVAARNPQGQSNITFLLNILNAMSPRSPSAKVLAERLQVDLERVGMSLPGMSEV